MPFRATDPTSSTYAWCEILKARFPTSRTLSPPQRGAPVSGAKACNDMQTSGQWARHSGVQRPPAGRGLMAIRPVLGSPMLGQQRVDRQHLERRRHLKRTDELLTA